MSRDDTRSTTAMVRAYQLPSDGDAARSARRFMRDLCTAVGCTDLVDDAAVVVSELVSNAVIHAATPSELRLRFADAVLRIEVADGSVCPPQVRAAAAGAENGRGLFLVDTLSRRWGCDVNGAGKVVWAELASAST